jgi:hypothetical protein
MESLFNNGKLFSGGRLQRLLFDEYGSLNKRIRNPETIRFFIVDDRSEKDIGADNTLYSYFCEASVEVLTGQSLKVTLQGNIPMGSKVKAWIKQYEAKHDDGVPSRLEFIIEEGQQARLQSLAAALRDIVAPGKRYSIPNYKYVCPRTAASLERLQGILDKAWSA